MSTIASASASTMASTIASTIASAIASAIASTIASTIASAIASASASASTSTSGLERGQQPSHVSQRPSAAREARQAHQRLRAHALHDEHAVALAARAQRSVDAAAH